MDGTFRLFQWKGADRWTNSPGLLRSAHCGDIAAQNKAVVYDLLFRAASQTMLTIAADPRHLGARIGITAVLHS